MTRRQLFAVGCSAVAFAAILPACSVRGLNLIQDTRLTITDPGDRERVRLPVTIRWTIRDFQITGRNGKVAPDAGYFGVFVDRAPQPPGRTQEWLFRDSQRCDGVPSCPDGAMLAESNIFSTSKTTFTIQQLAAPPPDAPERREFHEATIVLLDGRGARIGESAFRLEFEVARDA